MADSGAEHDSPDAITDRAVQWTIWGATGALPPDAEPLLIDAVRNDPSPAARTAALVALVRAGLPSAVAPAWRTAALDPDPGVRRRAAELAPQVDELTADDVIPRLSDDDELVAEAAAWALGELGDPAAVETLVPVATGHDDPLVREAAVAALGALGDRRALPTILAACRDKPAIRRRAVLALAPFDGPDVDAALRAALDDRDWQVRQAAEDLLAQ